MQEQGSVRDVHTDHPAAVDEPTVLLVQRDEALELLPLFALDLAGVPFHPEVPKQCRDSAEREIVGAGRGVRRVRVLIPGFTGEGGKRDLVLDVKSKDFPALFAVEEHLHRGALAGGEGMLVAVESGTAPADEAGRVFRGASLRPGVLRDR